LPTYNFRHKKSGRKFTKFVSIAACEEYLNKNPNIVQEISCPAIVSGISTRLKPSKDFREILKEVKKKNPKSKINDFGG